jgi:GT2 family glycosyltransferase
MKKSSPIIGILILNRDGKKWLPSVYASIRAQQYRHFRTYLVDNSSTDGSVELTLKNYPEVTVIRMPQNLGYSMAYNLAMPYAFVDGCDWVILANNDTRLEPGCLNELVRVAVANPRIGVVGPAFLEWEKDEPNYYILGNHPNAVPAMRKLGSEPMDVDWVEGSFLMVSRRCVEAVGPLDPYYFMYSEETDFCRRARYQGWKVLLVPNALARHYAGGSSEGSYEIRRAMNCLQTRNYYIYHLSNPFQSFSKNMLETAHLFGVRVKEHLNNRSTALIFFETHVLFFILRNLRTVFLKWQRDRAGGKPPMTTPDLQPLKPEILRNHAHFEGRDALPLAAMRVNE